MYKIMFSAGETSGDMHGANLAKALKNICSDIEMFGFGGPQMEQAGVKLCKNMLDYSVMGFWEVLVNLRKMFKLKDALVAEMKKQKPDILVLIDYPDFNWRLAKEAKKMNIPVFSYIPPSAWAWRKGRAKEVAKIADKIVAIFPFELDVYKKAGADISFVGNPLMDNVKASMSREMAAEFFGIDLKEDNILLLPGSRKQEIEKFIPLILELVQKKEMINENFILKLAHKDHIKYIEELENKYKFKLDKIRNIEISFEKIDELRKKSKYAIATSGTVTFELSLMGLPVIVVYKTSLINAFIVRKILKIKYITLTNLNSRKEIFARKFDYVIDKDIIFNLRDRITN